MDCVFRKSFFYKLICKSIYRDIVYYIRIMDAVLTTIKPIVQGLVENELKTVIEENIDKIDTIEPTVDAKLGEVAGKIKALIIDNINKIPFVPDSIKKGFISQIPVDKLIEIINGFDFEPFKATLLAIPTTGISDPTKLNQIKTTLTGLPDKIKSLLIKHIESVFNGTAVVPQVEILPNKLTSSVAVNTNTIMDDKVKMSLEKLSDSEKKEAIDNIMKYLKSTGMLEEIKLLICTPAVVADADVLPAPPADVVGGSKQKRRRKTKKNIYQWSRGRTQYGRKF